MKVEDRIAHWFEDGESRASFLKWGWLVSLLVLALGYAVILVTLFW